MKRLIVALTCVVAGVGGAGVHSQGAAHAATVCKKSGTICASLAVGTNHYLDRGLGSQAWGVTIRGSNLLPGSAVTGTVKTASGTYDISPVTVYADGSIIAGTTIGPNACPAGKVSVTVSATSAFKRPITESYSGYPCPSLQSQVATVLYGGQNAWTDTAVGAGLMPGSTVTETLQDAAGGTQVSVVGTVASDGTISAQAPTYEACGQFSGGYLTATDYQGLTITAPVTPPC